MHIVLSPDGLGYGAGHYGLDPLALDRMRRRMCDAGERGGLEAALECAGAVQSTLDPPDLARMPKGYAADPDWSHLLRRKSPTAHREAETAKAHRG